MPNILRVEENQQFLSRGRTWRDIRNGTTCLDKATTGQYQVRVNVAVAGGKVNGRFNFNQ